MIAAAKPIVRSIRAAVVVTCAVVALVGLASHSEPPAGPRLTVIVRARPGFEASTATSIERVGGRIVRPLGIIGGFSATIAANDLDLVRGVRGVRSVTVSQSVELLSSNDLYDPHQDRSSLFNLEAMIGVRGMWDKYTGRGIDVAVLDSGVTPVPGLTGAGKVLHGPDLTEESQNPSTAHLDTFGHGTHMAGIIAGRDSGVDPAANRGSSAPFLGVAPAARVVSVKVANARGTTDVSQVIAGIDWIVQHAYDPGLNIRVLNLSFGTDSSQAWDVDPLAFAVDVAWRRGIVVVTSAGNSGTTLGHLTNPARNPSVIAVGADNVNGTATTDDDSVPSWSSTGDGVRNPDVVAPGVSVQSLRVPGSYIDSAYSSTGALPGGRYFRGSGTSQAAAIVSGSVALLLEQNPTYSPDQIKSLLVGTAKPLKLTSATAQGAGVVDLRKARATAVSAIAPPAPTARGGGSLDAARGTGHLVLRGIELRGETDIFGVAVDCVALAAAELTASAWTGGTWNGSSWSGSSWSGSSWSGSSWSGNDWSGSSWSNANWSSGVWSGSAWSGSSWSGSSWSGSSWSGSSWSGSSWSTFWATVSWS